MRRRPLPPSVCSTLSSCSRVSLSSEMGISVSYTRFGYPRRAPGKREGSCTTTPPAPEYRWVTMSDGPSGLFEPAVVGQPLRESALLLTQRPLEAHRPLQHPLSVATGQ